MLNQDKRWKFKDKRIWFFCLLPADAELGISFRNTTSAGIIKTGPGIRTCRPLMPDLET